MTRLGEFPVGGEDEAYRGTPRVVGIAPDDPVRDVGAVVVLEAVGRDDGRPPSRALLLEHDRTVACHDGVSASHDAHERGKKPPALVENGSHACYLASAWSAMSQSSATRRFPAARASSRSRSNSVRAAATAPRR